MPIEKENSAENSEILRIRVKTRASVEGDRSVRVEFCDVIGRDLEGNVVSPELSLLGGAFDEIAASLSDLPTRFALGQNYPNPFNPSTTILYELPKAGHVTLVIYNMLGQVVNRMVDAQQAAGSFKVKWDASNVASGIYFYRLQAGEFVDTKKMLLLH